MEVATLRVKSELQLLAYTTAAATRDQAASATYTTAHGNTGPLTHLERPGIEPNWIRFCCATTGTPILSIYLFVYVFVSLAF